MNENDLMNALDDRADSILVGPAPIDTMTRVAARTRRRTTLVMGTAGLAVLAVAGVGVAVGLAGDNGGTNAPDRTVEVAAADVPPDGYVYVGVGSAAIAVPDDWPRNDTECSQVARGDTYVIDQGGVACMMLVPYPANTTSVTIAPADPTLDTATWTPVEVDGADALRSPTETGDPGPELGGGPFTTISVYLPEQDALFSATSSVSEAAADALLDGIVVLDEHVAVPGFSDLGLDGGRADDAFIDRLQALGLEVELLPQVDRMKRPAGEVISVVPQPGTVVEPGSTVTVTAAR